MPCNIQTRHTAIKGEYVRLYCHFVREGFPADPVTQPVVTIVTNEWHQESSSTSSGTSSMSLSTFESMSSEPGEMGPFYAERENRGVWYVDVFIPETWPTGHYYDIWKYQWLTDSEIEGKTFEIDVHEADETINWISPEIVHSNCARVAELLNDLENNFIHEAQHIPMYWEQGYKHWDDKTLDFAYKNWRTDYRVMIRKNNRLMEDGWYADYNGTIRMERAYDPEDHFFAHYYFRYFSQEELLDFLNMGLRMMNSTPPASTTYNTICNTPREWDAGILLYGAVTALRRLVFGFNFQERAFVLGDDGAEQQRKIDNMKQLYAEYNEIWLEVKKDVKTRRLPGITAIVIPEYTLPGGRCMSADTCIKCKMGNVIADMMIEEMLSVFEAGDEISALSNKNGNVVFSPISMIWRSGKKLTYTLETIEKSIRLSEEHLVYLPNNESYVPTKNLKQGDTILVLKDNLLIPSRLTRSPSPYQVEEVFDIEIPKTENFIGNDIVSHNSRWFRYLYKA